MKAILLVSLGGFFGAISRYGISQFVLKKTAFIFPIGTLFINCLGSFLLGIIYAGRFSPASGLLLGTGFMGAFTTFSTFKLENVRLRERGNKKTSVCYLLSSYGLGVLFAYAGCVLGSKFE